MSDQPWRSIRDGIVQLNQDPLRLHEAKQQPCQTCATTPCCTFVPLHKFRVETLIDLDHAGYLLNFEHIELTIAESGEWSVFYRYPCRFLDRAKHACTVHNSPEQPHVCVNYNPYNCWYKRVFTQSEVPDLIRLDRRRYERIAELCVFDELRRIQDVPSWKEMLEISRSTEAEPAVDEREPTEDGMFLEWQKLLREMPSTRTLKVLSYQELADPCTGCDAYCCETLTFPREMPRSFSSLDYIRFCLGYPGVELGVSQSGWFIVLKTRCRHLKDNRCSIYGKPERPLYCHYYDAHRCVYKPRYGQPRPPDFLRVRLEEFEWLSECFKFDEHGDVVEMMASTEAIRGHIESRYLASLKG